MHTPPPLRLLSEDLPEVTSGQVPTRLFNTCPILTHDIHGRSRKHFLNLLKRFVFGLWHEEHLIHPADGRNAAVESQTQTRLAHGFLHGCEVVCHDEGHEEEERVGGCHPVAAEVCWVYFRWNDPGETGVAAEKALVDDETGKVEGFDGHKVRLEVDLVTGADENKTDEEAGERNDSPEAAAEGLHEENGGDRSEQQGTATDEGHIICIFLVESDLVHKHTHVVHDGIDTRHLPKDNHNVGVDEGAAGTRNAVDMSVWCKSMGYGGRKERQWPTEVLT